jgi:hypothetical protein
MNDTNAINSIVKAFIKIISQSFRSLDVALAKLRSFASYCVSGGVGRTESFRVSLKFFVDLVLRLFCTLKFSLNNSAPAEEMGEMLRYKLKPNGKTSNCAAASKRGFSSHCYMCEFSPDSSPSRQRQRQRHWEQKNEMEKVELENI